MDRTETARADALSALGAEEQQVINRLIDWANEQPPIRALLLTGSRANPRACIDRLSDYDIEMAVTDTRPFAPDERWLQWYGTPLVMFRDSNIADGLEAFARLVLYEDGTRIDYNFYPVQLLAKVVAAPELPRDLDLGYHVLVDKDDLTKGLKPPGLHGWAKLDELYVEERWRDQGIGSWLVQHAIEWLRLAGGDRIVLAVGMDDDARGAGRFYRRFGWDIFVRETRSWRRQEEGALHVTPHR